MNAFQRLAVVRVFAVASPRKYGPFQLVCVLASRDSIDPAKHSLQKLTKHENKFNCMCPDIRNPHANDFEAEIVEIIQQRKMNEFFVK